MKKLAEVASDFLRVKSNLGRLCESQRCSLGSPRLLRVISFVKL